MQQHRLPEAPQKFIDQQRQAFGNDLSGQLLRNDEGAVQSLHIGVALRAAVGADHHNAHLHKAGQHGGKARAHHAQSGKAQQAEDEQRVEHKVHRHGDDAGLHGQRGLAGFPQRARVDLRDGEGNEARQHHPQILPRKAQRGGGIGGGGARRDVGQDHRLPGGQKQRQRAAGQHRADDQLDAEGLAHAVQIALPVELGAVDARTGGAAENAQIKHEEQLVDDGYGAHGQGAHLTDHHVVQQADHVGEGVLHDDRQNNDRHPAVKPFGADETFPQGQGLTGFHDNFLIFYTQQTGLPVGTVRCKTKLGILTEAPAHRPQDSGACPHRRSPPHRGRCWR